MNSPDCNPDRNAAIWYAEDGYDPEKKGINGRRVAGASFLKGFLDHADVSEVVSMTTGSNRGETFGEMVANHPRALRHRAVYQQAAEQIAPVGCMYYPSPNYAEYAFIRQAFGAAAYSICGITHTTATQAVMRGLYDLRAAPQMEWDAVICTSRAVHASTLRNIEIADEALRERFGSLPPRPQMPIIPLGVTTADYAFDEAARASLRGRMGWEENDIVVATLSRLLPYGKFDPAPVFIALQNAQEALGNKRKLHFLACGIYADDHSRIVFEGCARALMPDVSFTYLDGADATARRETLSGCDIFAFLVDNIQETFGLAPIEAMAAGRPLIVSDWDGMRDTVSRDVGIRIPTMTIGAQASMPEAKGYLTGAHSYPQYTGRLSSVTSIDIRAMSESFVALAKSKEKRHKMGTLGEKRARTLYDWSVIIPQMQDLWAELASIRRYSSTDAPRCSPVGPLPMDLFSSYPGSEAPRSTDLFVTGKSKHTVAEIFKLRRLAAVGNPFEKQNIVEQIYGTIKAAGQRGISIDGIASRNHLNRLTVERCVLFLLKFSLIVPGPKNNPCLK